MCVCVYIYIYVCIYICVYMCIYVYICISETMSGKTEPIAPKLKNEIDTYLLS